jgi:transposase
VKFSIIVDILLTFHMMRRHLTGNEAAQAVGIFQAGQVQRAVAGQFNVSQNVISRLWNGFQHTGNVAERPRSGRPRKTTMRQNPYLSNMAKRQRFQSAAGSILTFVQLQEYVCHHKQSETDCIQLICVPTDLQFVPY